MYVYAIESFKDKRIYVGQTSDLKKRLNEHNSGAVKTTRYFKPWRLFYSEKCSTRKIARQREKYLKSGCGKEFLKRLRPCSSEG